MGTRGYKRIERITGRYNGIFGFRGVPRGSGGYDRLQGVT